MSVAYDYTRSDIHHPQIRDMDHVTRAIIAELPARLLFISLSYWFVQIHCLHEGMRWKTRLVRL